MLARFDFLFPSIYFVIVSALGTAFFMLKPEDKEISFKVFAIYTLIALLGLGLLGLTGLSLVQNAAGLYFGLQFAFFVAGMIHVWALYKFNDWASREGVLNESVFTLFIAMVGAFGFLVLFSLLNKEGYGVILTSSAIFFMVPFLVEKSFDLMLNIPEEVYPKWYFPTDQAELDIPDDMMEDSNIIVVEFRMAKTTAEDSEEVHSRSKLPTKIELGKFFPVFLDQYNDRNPGNRIEFLDENKQPYGWNFYLQPKWYQFPTYLDPALTIRENDIKENDIIIAERV